MAPAATPKHGPRRSFCSARKGKNHPQAPTKPHNRKPKQHPATSFKHSPTQRLPLLPKKWVNCAIKHACKLQSNPKTAPRVYSSMIELPHPAKRRHHKQQKFKAKGTTPRKKNFALSIRTQAADAATKNRLCVPNFVEDLSGNPNSEKQTHLFHTPLLNALQH